MHKINKNRNSKKNETSKNLASKNSMWIYGKHAVRATLLNPKREVLRLILLESNKNFLEDAISANIHSELIANSNISPEIVDANYFFSLFGRDATHQGCAVLVKKLEEMSLDDLIKDKSDDRPFIFLDQVTDPQNIGSVLRASAVFDARAVVITADHSPEITPTIAKTASGALESVPLVHVVNLAQSINYLKEHGFWVVGLDERSEKELSEIDLHGKFIFIIGSEGTGMRRLTKEACDFVAQLPGSKVSANNILNRSSTNSFTTLNAAQAATVTLYESCRQRQRKIREESNAKR